MVMENCFTPEPLNTHTNTHCVRGRRTLNDIERQFDRPVMSFAKFAKTLQTGGVCTRDNRTCDSLKNSFRLSSRISVGSFRYAVFVSSVFSVVSFRK